MDLWITKEKKPKVAVFSHERSGTHFLMNTIAKNFSYKVNPWWDLDFPLGVNFRAESSFANYLSRYAGKSVLNIMKGHQPVDFFPKVLPHLCRDFRLFYVWRDPRDVMVSYWQYINFMRKHDITEGPKCKTAGEFMRTEPSGGMLRYQMNQIPTVFHRWIHHVQGWLAAKEAGADIHVVQFDDLANRFDDTVRKVAAHLGTSCESPIRPARKKNTVLPGSGVGGRHRLFLKKSDLDWMEEVLAENGAKQLEALTA